MIRTKYFNSLLGTFQAGLMALLMGLAGQAHALLLGWEGDLNGTERTFNLTARADFISTSDGNSHYTWGYSHGTDFAMQYPGPTLIVNQGETVKILLNNTLPVPVSIVFPGQQDVTATGGNPGVLTREAPAVPNGLNTVAGGPTYTFVASQAGTYQYHSGTNPDLQVEMGLVGVIIVRPAGFANGTGSSHPARKAYVNPGTQYDRETLFLLTEMDPAVHWAVYGMVNANLPVEIDTTTIKPSLWFINGRNGPDTELDDYVYWLPTQPYSALPRMHPGERLLMRVVNAGRDLHPFHHHGNHATPIARDGRVLASVDGGAPDLASPDFTVRSIPGQSMDLIYEWTGKGIGWDIYGLTATNPHTCVPDADGFHSVATDKNYREWCGDHNKDIPVIVPGQLDVSYGGHYSASPFLGLTGSLPQGHPGLNTTGGYYHMLHSHNEKEVTTDNIFPGGMMTMLIVEPWTVDLDAKLGPVVNAGSAGATSGTTTMEFAFAGTGGANVGTLNGTRDTLDFGNRNGLVFNTLTLMNTGVVPAVISIPKVTNINGNNFALVSETCSANPVLVLGTCQIRVSFNAPSTGNNVAAKTGALTVIYNGSGPAVLGLTGR
jgi:FtsP/CotA-like multicopper oxidase with cupredoxin domain